MRFSCVTFIVFTFKMMERGESIELDEFERFRVQAFSGTKRKVTSTKSLPVGGRDRRDQSLASGSASGSSAQAQGAGGRRSSRMEMVLKEEGYMTTMVEESFDDPDSGGSATEDAKLLRRSGSGRSSHREDYTNTSRSRSTIDRSGSKSPMLTNRNWLVAQPNRLGRSYSCKPRTKPRSSAMGGAGGGKDAKEGAARPRSGSAAHVFKTPVTRHSSLTTPAIFGDGEVEIYRVRSFTTTAKGIVKHGDSFKIRSSPAPRTKSMMRHKEPDIVVATSPPDSRSDADSSLTSREDASLEPDIPEVPEKEEAEVYKVLITGSPGVGKTALTQQFKTSDYLGNRDMPGKWFNLKTHLSHCWPHDYQITSS